MLGIAKLGCSDAAPLRRPTLEYAPRRTRGRASPADLQALARPLFARTSALFTPLLTKSRLYTGLTAGCRRSRAAFAESPRFGDDGLIGGLNGDLAILLFQFRNRNHYFQNAVAEVRLYFLKLGTFRQRNHAVEPAVGSLRMMPAAFFASLFPTPFATDHQAFFIAFELDVVFREAGQVGANQ